MWFRSCFPNFSSPLYARSLQISAPSRSAPQVCRRHQICGPEIFRPFPSHTLRVSSLSFFDHFHRLPAIHFPLTPPTHITLFSFSLLISHTCSLTTTLPLLSQPSPWRLHNDCGSETTPSRRQSPVREYILCYKVSIHWLICQAFQLL
jgi:hypothetical protein